MKFDKAPHIQALKKRVERFFNSDTSKRTEVHEIINFFIRNEINIFSFGGLVRDIGLFSVREFDSDVDLVVDVDRDSLYNLIISLDNKINITIKENKFGGFRLYKNNWCFDIWCIKDTWAIKEHHVEYMGVESLLHTTFLNWDAILFDINSKKIICNNDYLSNLSGGELDIVLKHTPNELGALIRIIRAIYGKGVRRLRDDAIEFIFNGFCNYQGYEILDYELSAYNKPILDDEKLDNIKKFIFEYHSKVNFNDQINIDLDVNVISLELSELFGCNKFKNNKVINKGSKVDQLWLNLFD